MSKEEMRDTVREAMSILRDEAKVKEMGLELLPGEPDSTKNIQKYLGNGSYGDITKHRNAIRAESKSPTPARPLPEKLLRAVCAVWEETCKIADNEARAKADGLISAAEERVEEIASDYEALRVEYDGVCVELANEKKAVEAARLFVAGLQK